MFHLGLRPHGDVRGAYLAAIRHVHTGAIFTIAVFFFFHFSFFHFFFLAEIFYEHIHETISERVHPFWVCVSKRYVNKKG